VTKHKDRQGRLLAPPSIVGLAASLVLAGISFTPSLLPRPFVMQGVITGISMAVGYGIGVFAVWVARRFTTWQLSPASRRVAWVVAGCRAERAYSTGSAKKSRGVRKHTWSIVSLSRPISFIASCTRGTMK
jgi:uncharacterized membrane protein